MSNRSDPAAIEGLSAQVARQETQLFADLRSLVELESPSDDKRALDTCGQQLREWAAVVGAHSRLHKQRKHGDHVEIGFSGPRSQAPLLLLGHFDTVWPLGTLATMPFLIKGDRAWGPGVLDMKSGIVFAFHAITALKQVRGKLPRPIKLLLVSDEEIGSPSSREITEKIARQCAAVYVLEPAQGPEGAYKTSRKGVGEYRVTIHGRASHAGLDFEAGANAILEMARQIGRMAGFTDLESGITVNSGLVQGGTRSNVVPAQCVAEVDVRIAKLGQAKFIDRKFHSLKPLDPRCRIEVSGGINRPPMERTPRNLKLYRQARGIARSMGFDLPEKGVGGGSDGNFTSALGIPTLDGMGAVGQGAHAADESILTAHVVPRVALLAAMLQTDLVRR